MKLGRPLADIRYFVEFVPIDGEPDKGGSWICEDLSIGKIHEMCRGYRARAFVFDPADASRTKRLVIVPPTGISMGTLCQLEWAEQQRALLESRSTFWDHLLRDEFG